MRVPGSGLHIDNPAWPLIQAVISYWGTTDDAGAAGGLSIIDSRCTGALLEPSYEGLGIKLLSSDAAGQVRKIFVHDLATGEMDINPLDPFTDNAGAAYQIPAGTRFCILSAGGGGGGGAALSELGGEFALPDGVAVQVVLTITPIKPMILSSFYLDLVNLTQNATVRVQYQIDGANYRIIVPFNWTVGMDDGVYFRAIAFSNLLQVTIQSVIAEGAIRDIPWQYFLEG